MLIVLYDLRSRKDFDPNSTTLDTVATTAVAWSLIHAARALVAQNSAKDANKTRKEWPAEPAGDDLMSYVTWGGDGGRNCD